MKLRHYTLSDSTCDGWKELEPIDENLSYDFNYQVEIYTWSYIDLPDTP